MILDVDARLLIDGDAITRLPRQQCLFLAALADGSVVTYDTLIQAVWGSWLPSHHRHSVGVLAHKVARSVPVGNVKEVGYQLYAPITVRRVSESTLAPMVG